MKNYIIQFILIICFLPFAANAQGWEKIYDNEYNERTRSADLTLDGGVIMAGTSRNLQTNTQYSYLTKVDADEILELQYYDSIHSGLYVNTLDVLSTSDNNYLLSSLSTINGTNYDYLVQKINTNGTVVWGNNVNTSIMKYVINMTETADGGYIWIGDNNDNNTGLNSIGVLRIDANGNEIWGQNYTADEPIYTSTVKETANGDIIIVGYQDSGTV